MKTIKTKKSTGKAYVFIYASPKDRQATNSLMSRELAERSRDWHIKVGYLCSEISEVELFEEVEENIPDVVERWYFVAVHQDGSDKMFSRTDLAALEEGRKECVELGYRCSEIKILREEF